MKYPDYDYYEPSQPDGDRDQESNKRDALIEETILLTQIVTAIADNRLVAADSLVKYWEFAQHETGIDLWNTDQEIPSA